jgi:hypothetical protein
MRAMRWTAAWQLAALVALLLLLPGNGGAQPAGNGEAVNAPENAVGAGPCG